MSKKQVEFLVNSIFLSIKSALKNNEKVEIRGFGSFHIRNKNAKSGRNPKTGEKIDIPACKVPFFRPGKELKKQLLKNDSEIRKVLKGNE